MQSETGDRAEIQRLLLGDFSPLPTGSGIILSDAELQALIDCLIASSSADVATPVTRQPTQQQSMDQQQ